jgi:hypothetical protein
VRGRSNQPRSSILLSVKDRGSRVKDTLARSVHLRPGTGLRRSLKLKLESAHAAAQAAALWRLAKEGEAK